MAIKKLILFLFALVLLSSAATALTNSSLVEWWSFDEGSGNAVGQKQGLILVETGTVPNSSQYLGAGARGTYDDSPAQYLKNQSMGFSFDNGANWSVSWWYRSTGGTAHDEHLFNFLDASGTATGVPYRQHTTQNLLVNFPAGQINTAWSPATGAWYHTTLVFYANDTVAAYINGTFKGAGVIGAVNPTTGIKVGCYWTTGAYCSEHGVFDELNIWNVSLNTTEIAELVAGATYVNVSPPGPTPGVNFTITAADEWTSGPTADINASICNGATCYSYTNATGERVTTEVLDNSTLLWNITVASTNYFNRTYLDQNVSGGNLVAYLHQVEVCFNATAKVSEAAITLNNVTINGTVRTAAPFCYNITATTLNVQAKKTGWYSRNQSFTLAPLSNTTETIANLSYANLTIYAKDASTNASLSGYDLTIKSLNYSGWTGETAAGVTNYSFYLINGTYNVTIDVPGYELTSAQANVTVNGSTNYTFTLYKQNSISITIRDEITNDLINASTITARFTNNATTWENTTSTGYLFVYNLTPATYTILFYGGGYSTRTYTVTVGDRSTQTLTAYMISSNYSTTFTIKDADTADTLDNVSVSMYKLINSTWTIVESKYSDVSGRALFYYDPIGSYKFYLSKPDYIDYVFFLDPILFSSYDVYMSKSSLLNASEDFEGLAIIYAPQSFANNNVTTFNFIISSPDGLLTEYGINLTYPTGGQVNQTGYNAIGSQLGVSVNVTNATAYDRVRLDYYYITSTVGRRNFTVYFPIEFNVSAADLTFLSNKNKTYGLGIFERILIITIVVLFVVGIATLVGQPIPGLGLGLFCFGYMAYIGFVPLWAILPSMFIGVLFLVWKSGGY